MSNNNLENTVTANDVVNHPRHYTCHPCGIEIIEITSLLSFDIGNAVKYLARFRYKKKPREDYNKALWYIKHFIETKASAITSILVIDDYNGNEDQHAIYTIKLLENLDKLKNSEPEDAISSFYNSLITCISHYDDPSEWWPLLTVSYKKLKEHEQYVEEEIRF